MSNVRIAPKKHLGQHFLTDLNIARKIAASLNAEPSERKVIEVGPGMGVLTQFLLELNYDLIVAEIDYESVNYLHQHFPKLQNRVIEGDFLQLDLNAHLNEHGAVIGNFPYNISSQILFHCLDFRPVVSEIVGMFQKEVAERIASTHGNKTYGILSVLMQTYYTTTYLFTVNEHVFSPPPKVKSAVIKLVRRAETGLTVPDRFFKTVVKTAFNQRRKTLRNALKPLFKGSAPVHPFMDKRAEQLSIAEFAILAELIHNQ
jgi:16S rRNA (adenine1518-N6/adenine1519-N6)-dimethyltransferase